MITCEITNQKDIIVYHEDGKTEIITNFRPYFYDDKKNKIFAKQPGDVKELRTHYSHTYEADISYLLRYMIDRVPIPIKKEFIRCCYIDIETLMSIDDVNTPEPVLSITCYDNKLQKYFTFTWNCHNIKTDNWCVYSLKDEKEMFEKFISFMQQTNPDLMTGWNVEYDIRYIFNRMLKLQMNAHQLGRFGYSSAGKGEYADIHLKGRIVFDLKEAYKRLIFTQLESFSLEFVSQKELGRGKVKLEKSIDKIWKETPQQLLGYNLEDVKLIVELDKKLSIVDYFDELRRMVGCPWTLLNQNSMIIDTLVLRKAKSREVVLPTKIRHEQEEPIEGAYVHQPTAGIYKNVIVLDVRSLYPSIIVSANLSPETFSRDGDIDVGFNGYKFKSEPEGLVPSVIRDLFELRKKYKAEMKKYHYDSPEYHSYDLKQYAVKVVLNSAYGSLGYPGFRLYKREVAESVTSIGREIIKFAKKKAEDFGYVVIYADTDSLMLISKETDLEKVVEDGKIIQEKINSSFPEFIEQKGIKSHIFHFEFEKIFSKMYFSKAKKRYCGYLCYKDGKELPNLLKVTGFEIRRSDTPKAGKDIQDKVFRMLLDGKTQEEIESFVAEMKKQIKQNPNYIDIAIPKGVGRNFEDYINLPIHIRAIKYSIDNLDIVYRTGEKVKWVYVSRSPPDKPKTNVVGFYDEFPQNFEIDWDKMMPLIIDNILERIYESLEWEKKIPQKNLNNWF